MSYDAYQSARRDGHRQLSYNKAHGLSPYPAVLEEIEPKYTGLPRKQLGILNIDPELIGGTVTAGRMSVFSADFLPLPEPDSEFGAKWRALYDSIVNEGQKQPAIAFEYYGKYYILEGNKRVSVTRRLGGEVEAEVTRVIPEPEDSKRYRLYKEYVRFFEDTRYPGLRFSREGAYDQLCAMAEQKSGQRWPQEDVNDLATAYTRFSEVYRAESRRERMPVDVSTAMLLLIRLFGYRDFIDAMPARMREMLRQVQPEMTVVGAEMPAVIEEAPVTEEPGLLRTIFKRDEVLRVGFLHNGVPQRLGWTYWHELSRKQLEGQLKGRIETVSCINTDPEDAEGVIETWVSEGVKVIFATSPVLYGACARQAVKHPETIILTCSPKGDLGSVCAYYIRQFEAKFILGAIAGAMTRTNRVGYVAEYPILTTPSCINAFALGVSMTNPDAQVVLDWSTLIDHKPEEALIADGVDIISGHDLISPAQKDSAFGLYRLTNGEPEILAVPVSRWVNVYRSILDSIMAGSWEADKRTGIGVVTQYYAGMASGAVDVSFGTVLPSGVRRLAEMLRTQLRDGSLMVFEGPLVDRNGEVQLAGGRSLSLSEVINMDYLNSNITGRIPSEDELRPEMRPVVHATAIGSYGKGVL